MSNIHSLEPQAYGLIKLQTTFGDLDIELFTKQCPKITRNFVKLCLDKFYDKAKLYKLEKDFIGIVGEFRTKPHDTVVLPDEIHSRLRFTRRGLVATANTKKDANGPEFFFTLGPTQELQGKHTIFGRVLGDSLYNLVDLNDSPVDSELRPKGEKIVIRVTVIENPFSDLESTTLDAVIEDQNELERSSSDDEDSDGLGLNQNKKLSFFPGEDEDDEEKEGDDEGANLNQYKLDNVSVTKPVIDVINSHPKPNNIPGKELNNQTSDQNLKNNSKEVRLQEIRTQIQLIKNQLQGDKNIKSSDLKDAESPKEDYSHIKKESKLPIKIKRLREQETMELLKTFKKKLKQLHSHDNPIRSRDRVHDELVDESQIPADELAALDQVDGDEWLFHKFDADEEDSKNNRFKNSSYLKEKHRKHASRDG